MYQKYDKITKLVLYRCNGRYQACSDFLVVNALLG